MRPARVAIREQNITYSEGYIGECTGVFLLRDMYTYICIYI